MVHATGANAGQTAFVLGLAFALIVGDAPLMRAGGWYQPPFAVPTANWLKPSDGITKADKNIVIPIPNDARGGGDIWPDVVMMEHSQPVWEPYSEKLTRYARYDQYRKGVELQERRRSTSEVQGGNSLPAVTALAAKLKYQPIIGEQMREAHQGEDSVSAADEAMRVLRAYYLAQTVARSKEMDAATKLPVIEPAEDSVGKEKFVRIR